MSASIESSWPSPAAPFQEHVAQLRSGISVLQDLLVLPDDKRFETAYAVMATGRGTKSAVEAIGDPASGKTVFGDYVLGPGQMVAVQPDDVADSFYGYTNPINGEEHILGSLGDLSRPDLRIFLNEIGNLRNVRPLLTLWDRPDIQDAVVYLTTNFPDSSSVHKHDPALESRIAVQILAGDHDRATKERIQAQSTLREELDISSTPLLPPTEARKALRQGLLERHPLDSDAASSIGKYTVAVIESLNQSGLVTPVGAADARLGTALVDAARSRMLVERIDRDENGVQLVDIAKVFSLVLPKMVGLSRPGAEAFMDLYSRKANPLERAIAVRRAVARVAFTTLYKQGVADPYELVTTTEKVEKAVDRYSHANLTAAGKGYGGTPVDIDQVLARAMSSDVIAETGEKHGRRSLRLRKRS